jgi:hypothetical protein
MKNVDNCVDVAFCSYLVSCFQELRWREENEEKGIFSSYIRSLKPSNYSISEWLPDHGVVRVAGLNQKRRLRPKGRARLFTKVTASRRRNPRWEGPERILSF